MLALGVLASPAGAQVEALRERLAAAERDGASAQERADLHFVLGRVLASSGRLEEAETELEAALALRESALGRDDDGVVEIVSGLGIVAAARGRTESAEAYLLRALRTRQKNLGSEAPAVGKTYTNLAALYTQTGRYDEAAEMLKRARAIHEKPTADGSHADQLVLVLKNEVVLLEKQGRLKEADASRERLVELALDRDPASLDAARALTTLARREREADDPGGASRLHAQALGVLGRRDLPPPTLVAENLAGLGWCEWQRGRAGEAEGRYRRAVAVLENTLGRDTPALRPILEEYASLLRDQGRDADAVSLEARAGRLASPEGGR